MKNVITKHADLRELNQDRIYHLDKGKVHNFKVTAQGFIELYGTVAEEGYLEYPQPNGTIEKEYVPVETLFDTTHIETTETSAITLHHPPRGIEVIPVTFQEYTVGTVKSVISNRKEKKLEVKLLLCREDAIKAVQSGITALSMGYTARRKHIKDNEYIQTERICNHIAIVKKGRAEGAKLHLDSVESDLIEFFTPKRITIARRL